MSDMGLLGKTTKFYKFKNMTFTCLDLFKYMFTYYKTLWWENGFSLIDLIKKCDLPVSRNLLIDDELNLVFVLPEVQPRLDSFQSSHIKFVGPCVDEAVRSKLSNEKKNTKTYVEIIEQFMMKNTLPCKILSQQPDILPDKDPSVIKAKTDLMRSDSNGDNFKRIFKPIIYVSMGTVFNNENKDLFQVLVDACRCYSKEYAIIISTGDEKTYERYRSSITNEILFVPHTPQVEILVNLLIDPNLTVV